MGKVIVSEFVALRGDARALRVLEYPVIDYPKELHEEDLRQTLPNAHEAPGR